MCNTFPMQSNFRSNAMYAYLKWSLCHFIWKKNHRSIKRCRLLIKWFRSSAVLGLHTNMHDFLVAVDVPLFFLFEYEFYEMASIRKSFQEYFHHVGCACMSLSTNHLLTSVFQLQMPHIHTHVYVHYYTDTSSGIINLFAEIDRIHNHVSIYTNNTDTQWDIKSGKERDRERA